MSTVVDPDTNEQDVVSVVDEPDVVVAEGLTCPNCGAPAEAGQLMCLECGSRLALDYQRPPSWRLPAAIVAVVLLIAGIGVAIALAAVTDDASRTTAGAPTQPAAATPPPQNAPADSAPTTSQATPAPTTSSTTPAPTPTDTTVAPAPDAPAATTGWPEGKSAYTVILASMPTKKEADAKLQAAKDAGISGAALLHSDDFPTLRPGYWVVFDGQYDEIDQAQGQAASDRSKGDFADAYPRFVSKDENAKP